MPLLVMLPVPGLVISSVLKTAQEPAKKSVVNAKFDHWVLSPDTVKCTGWARLVMPLHWPGRGIVFEELVDVAVKVGVKVGVFV
jgi:hypothetical protein